jgi:peroxiredoxin
MRIWVGAIAAVIGLILWAHNTTFPGKIAPDFCAYTTSGDKVRLSDLKGNVVLMDFWATWCGPCRSSLPHLQDTSENQAWAHEGLVVWAVNDRQSADDVSYFLSRGGYTFTALLDPDGAVCSEFGVRGIPMTVIVGRNGRVANVFVGWGGNSGQQIDDAIEKALAEPRN